MNTSSTAVGKITAFLNDDSRVLVLNGTHQNQKHVLALATALSHDSSGIVLFRVNARQNADLFLRDLGIRRVPRPGQALLVNGHRLYIDTMNPQSWRKTPDHVDTVVVYPVDSLGADRGTECLRDLGYRRCRKVLLVTWTDTRDFSWVDGYRPIRVTLDAADERPDYHARVRDLEEQARNRPAPRPRNLPRYTAEVPYSHLTRLHCSMCNRTTRARLNRPYPGKTALHDAPSGEYTATCLRCGFENTDSYNWYGR